MEGLTEGLRIAGLAGNEAKTYLELLTFGFLSANEVAKKLSMDRTLVYSVLNHLIDKGLVNYVVRDNKKFFEAADPANLLNSIKDQEIFVNDLIQKLKRVKEIRPTVHEISVYEGKAGIRSMMKEIMKHKSLVAFGSTGRAYDLFYEAPVWVKELVKKGMHGRIIMNQKYRGHHVTKMKPLVQVRYLNIASEATTTIFDDMIILHLIKEKPIMICIRNKEIAQGYQNYFEVLWNSAKP